MCIRTPVHLLSGHTGRAGRSPPPVPGCGPATGAPNLCLRQLLSALGFLIHGFWAGRESPIFGVWAAPAAPKTIPKGGGRRPPPSGMVFEATEATRTRKINDFRPTQKQCIKNSSGLLNCHSVFGLDQELATKKLYNWCGGIVLDVFCTICRTCPV